MNKYRTKTLVLKIFEILESRYPNYENLTDEEIDNIVNKIEKYIKEE